jgi:hypothetical protein
MNIDVNEIVDKIDAKPEVPEVMGEGVATEGPPQPAPNANDKVSSKIEMLIRREQQALARERQAKDREAQLEARLKAIEEREGKVNEFESSKKDPKKALGLLGLSYDELTQAQLNDGELPPQVEIKKLREEIEAFKQAQKQEKDHEKERQIADAKRQAEAQERYAVDTFKKQIDTYVEDNASRYELIKFEGVEDLVYDVIDKHYDKTLKAAQHKYESGEITQDLVVGKVMEIKEAADKVEEFLEQKYIKAKELNKTKSFWGAIPKEAQKQVVKEIQKQTPPRTLTNQLSASQTPPPKQGKILTDQERVQKAIAYARGLRPPV